MRVGIDISNAVLPRPTGVATYIRLLVKHLRLSPARHIELYCRRSRRRYFAQSDWSDEPVKWFTSRVRRRDVEVFHATDVRLPFWCEPPAVVTFHDLSALHRSDHATPQFLRKKRQSYADAARRAQFLITQTECVRKEILETFQLGAERVFRIPLSDALQLRCDPNEEPVLRGDDALIVGGPSRRKGVHQLPQLLTVLAARGWKPQLQWVGSAEPANARALFEEHSLEHSVTFHGHVSDNELSRLYSHCRALLVFSDTEGFGIPLLEAANRGCPVIAPECAVFREVLGDGGFWYRWPPTPDDFDAFFDDEERAATLERAEHRAHRHSWHDTAEETWRCYESCLAVESQRRA